MINRLQSILFFTVACTNIFSASEILCIDVEANKITCLAKLLQNPWKDKLAHAIGATARAGEDFFELLEKEYPEDERSLRGFTKDPLMIPAIEKLKSGFESVFSKKDDYSELEHCLRLGTIRDALHKLLQEVPEDQWKIARFFGQRTFFENVQKSLNSGRVFQENKENPYIAERAKEGSLSYDEFQEYHHRRVKRVSSLMQYLHMLVAFAPNGTFIGDEELERFLIEMRCEDEDDFKN